MTEKDISQKFRLKNATNNYLITEIYKNKLLSNKNKKVCLTLNFI